MRGCCYNFCVLSHQRTPSATGRGGTSLSTFNIDQYDNDTLSEAGVVKKDEVLRRAKYFLDAVIPVAEKYNVQSASPQTAFASMHLAVVPHGPRRRCKLGSLLLSVVRPFDRSGLPPGRPAGASAPRGRALELSCL